MNMLGELTDVHERGILHFEYGNETLVVPQNAPAGPDDEGVCDAGEEVPSSDLHDPAAFAARESRRKACTAAGTVISYKRRGRWGIFAGFSSWKPVRLMARFFRSLQKTDGWHLAQFFRQLSVLLKAGISPIRSLDICAQQTSHEAIFDKIQNLIAEIRAGSRFSQAMRHTKGIFNAYHAGAVQSFEAIGDLGVIFENLASLEEKNYDLRSRMRAVLAYPATICIISIVGLLCLVRFLLPLVRGVAERSEQAIPLPTKILMYLGDFTEKPLLIALGAIIIACTILLIRWLFTIPRVQILWEAIRFRLPYIGPIFRCFTVVQVSRSISALMTSNLPLTSTIELTGISCNSPYLREKVFGPAEEYVRRGESISQALGGQKIFPRSFHGMVAVGEQTGCLPDILLDLARIYELEMNVKIETALRAIEPLVLCLVGGLVLLVMICAFMPLYGTLSGIGAL
jgi:type II secretory pathway component PulF